MSQSIYAFIRKFTQFGSFNIRMQLVAAPVSLLNHSSPNLNVFQRFGFFSSSSAESKENETSQGSEDAEAMKATTGEAKESDILTQNIF